MDPGKPFTWEECVVNLVVLDMLEKNKTHDKLDYSKGYATHSYQYLKDQNSNNSLTKPFIESISENIIDK